MEKKNLRREMLAKRDGLTRDEIQTKSIRVADRLLALEAYSRAERIFTFLSFGSELDTRPIVEAALADGKTVIVPRVNRETKALDLYEIKGYDGLVPGGYGILEPTDDHVRVSENDVDLILVPGVAFDEEGGRLGYGAGFYDKILSKTRAALVALCFELQVVPEVPREPHDIPVPLILTEERVIRP